MLRRIGHARKRVTVLLRLLITKADVIRAVIKRCAQRLAPDSETTLYLGDIQGMFRAKFLNYELTQSIIRSYHHDDPESEPLRKHFIKIT